MHGMRRAMRLAGPMVALLLVACGPAPALILPSGPTASHASHDTALARAEAALTDAHGMTFAPAGPHHVVGTDQAGNQLDFIGVPVEEVVLTVVATDATAALAAADAYLPIAADLLGGPASVWTWVRDGLACRAGARTECPAATTADALSARFTDDGPAFWVVAITRN